MTEAPRPLSVVVPTRNTRQLTLACLGALAAAAAARPELAAVEVVLVDDAGDDGTAEAVAARHPEVPYEPQLIDATFALLIASTGDPLVIPALNRDGDILSDLVLPLFGSIAGSESLLVAFDGSIEEERPRA